VAAWQQAYKRDGCGLTGDRQAASKHGEERMYSGRLLDYSAGRRARISLALVGACLPMNGWRNVVAISYRFKIRSAAAKQWRGARMARLVGGSDNRTNGRRRQA